MFPQIPILAVSKTFQSITHKTLCRLGRKPLSNNIAFNFVSFNFSLRGTKRQGPAKRVLDWVEILIEFPQHCHLWVSGGANRYLKQVPLRQALNQVSTQNRNVKLLYGMLSPIAVAKLTWQSVTIWFCFSSSSVCEIMTGGWQLFSSGQTVVPGSVSSNPWPSECLAVHPHSINSASRHCHSNETWSLVAFRW